MKYIFKSFFLLVKDTLPTVACELPCLPQLKCLDNTYCKFFSSTYIHLFIQTHFWHLSTWRFGQTAAHTHTAPSSCRDPDGSKRDYWTASLSIQRSPINTDTTVQEHRVYLKRLGQDLFSCATQNYQLIIVSGMRRHTLGSRQPGTAHAERGDTHSFNYYKWVHTFSQWAGPGTFGLAQTQAERVTTPHPSSGKRAAK